MPGDQSPRTILGVTELAEHDSLTQFVQGSAADVDVPAVMVSQSAGEVTLADAGMVPEASVVRMNGSSITDMGRTSVSGDVANVNELAVEAAELAAEEAEQRAVPSYMASEGSVQADGPDDLQDAEAEAEAEEADVRSDTALADVGDVADLFEEADSKGDLSEFAAVASDIADLDVADLEDVTEDEGAAGPSAFADSAEAEAEAEEMVDVDGVPRFFMGLEGGGSVSDLNKVMSELNLSHKLHVAGYLGAPAPAADGAGPSS